MKNWLSINTLKAAGALYISGVAITALLWLFFVVTDWVLQSETHWDNFCLCVFGVGPLFICTFIVIIGWAGDSAKCGWA